MANKPRMGSDPFEKKDPLGWIDRDHADEPNQHGSAPSPPSNPSKLSKADKPSTQSPSSKASNPSKHALPGPPSTLNHPSTPGVPSKGSTTSKGLRPGWTRATFIVKEETVQQLKAVAYWDRKELKRVVEEAFRAYLEQKPINPIPPEDSIED
jgi:hypothetical protein